LPKTGKPIRFGKKKRNIKAASWNAPYPTAERPKKIAYSLNWQASGEEALKLVSWRLQHQES
jgi:uncharacterized protein YndB with AHSA1/START domain